MLIAPIVGNRKVSPVCDDNTFIKMAKVGRDLRKDFGKKVPLSVTYPGMVDGKEYIIASVNLTEGTPVHNIPAVFLCWSITGLLNHHAITANFRRLSSLESV